LHPLKALAAFAAVSLTWWIALLAFGSPLMAMVGSIALLGSVAEALFPIHHRVTESGVFTRCAWQMRQMSWDSVKGAWMGADGIHLSPFTRDTRLGRMRGVTLRFSDGNNGAVIEAVRRHLKREAT
jgi:hypothetical protein